MKKLMIIISIASMLFSCKTYKLTAEDLSWQPYEEHDKLIFKFSNGDREEVLIKDISRHINPDDPLTVFPNMVESLFVTSNKEILKLESTGSGGQPSITFSIKLNDERNHEYPLTVMPLNYSNEMIVSDRYIGKIKVFQIRAEQSYDNLKQFHYDLQFIYWCKEYGYVGLEFTDGSKWVLQSLIRNGVNIAGSFEGL
jgi:hypothetical protein